MKILEVIDTFSPVVDGAVNVVRNYADQLNKTDTCVVAAPKPARKQKYRDEETYKVLRCNSLSAPEGYRNALPFTDRKFKKALKAEKFDIIHVHSPFVLGRFCVKFAKKHRIPVVVTLHTKYKLDFIRTLHNFRPLVNFMMRFIMKPIKRADEVWTVSRTAIDTLREYGYKGDVKVVKSGTDFRYPDNAEELIDKINAAHGLAGQKNVFLFVGRVAMYKNLDIVIDALKIVKDSGTDFKMIMVGGGFDLKIFKERVEKAGLTENFIFTGAMTDRNLLQGYYLRSDLFLFPSTFDTCSLVSIEAAAHKLPTLVVKGSCPAENVKDGENGFLSEENGEDFAKNILRAISDGKALKEAGENAYKTIYRTWEDTAEELKTEYARIIEEYKGKTRGQTRG